ncbi:hypothetical protein AOQ84DRAFT_440293 [Glonium stellatum]|uniref:Uncharacterized protein n=1 Tax=Glonium stellatum TaxID=574774 RepID=A0A8E2EYK5_9PEZI|nr:hypothetical protein AOQ84DRAFT_440293 [Glonium stellatum]
MVQLQCYLLSKAENTDARRWDLQLVRAMLGSNGCIRPQEPHTRASVLVVERRTAKDNIRPASLFTLSSPPLSHVCGSLWLYSHSHSDHSRTFIIHRTQDSVALQPEEGQPGDEPKNLIFVPPNICCSLLAFIVLLESTLPDSALVSAKNLTASGKVTQYAVALDIVLRWLPGPIVTDPSTNTSTMPSTCQCIRTIIRVFATKTVLAIPNASSVVES